MNLTCLVDHVFPEPIVRIFWRTGGGRYGFLFVNLLLAVCTTTFEAIWRFYLKIHVGIQLQLPHFFFKTFLPSTRIPRFLS